MRLPEIYFPVISDNKRYKNHISPDQRNKLLYGKNQATPPKDVANKEVVQIQDLELRSAVFDKVKHTVPA